MADLLNIQKESSVISVEDDPRQYRLMAEQHLRRYGLIILIAVELLMSFSFLGYVHIPPISITFAYIPIMIAGCIMGVREAVLLGLLFGLISMFKSSAHFVLPIDQLFSPFLSGAPFGSFVLSVVSRTVFGLVIGLLYLAAKKSKYPVAGIVLVSMCGKCIHSLLVFTAMWLCFPDLGITPLNTFKSMIGWDNLIGVLVSSGSVFLCIALFRTKAWRTFYHNVVSAYELRLAVDYHKAFHISLTAVILVFSVAMAVYFAGRLTTLFGFFGVELPDYMEIDLIMLQIQFVIGMIALIMLFAMMLRLHYLNQSYLNHELMTDEVTKLLNRKNFFINCNETLKNIDYQSSSTVCFMIIDADYFKHINDTYGHMEGDRILREMAGALRVAFADAGIIGRLGGDEFAVLLYKRLDKADLEHRLHIMQDKVRSIPCGSIRVSCSTGAVMKKGPVSSDFLYKSADDMLYIAKERGRNQYALDSDD